MADQSGGGTMVPPFSENQDWGPGTYPTLTTPSPARISPQGSARSWDPDSCLSSPRSLVPVASGFFCM